MIFSKTLMAQLLRLVSGGKVAYSSLRNDIVEELIEEGLLTVRQNGSRRSLWAMDGEALEKYLEAKYEAFRGRKAIAEEDGSRASQASQTGNSKLMAVRSCPGFPVNAYDGIECRLNGEKFAICPADGSFTFVCDWKLFEVPEDVVVVGVENMENFRMIRLQREFFEREIPFGRLLFVSRYPQSSDLRQWLQTIPNPYVHFGDFDLAGISIFLTEFYPYLGKKASFMIPSDIESRLQKGSLERYNTQYAKYGHLRTDIPELQSLIDLIKHYHRCYDQEGYIGRNPLG